MFKLYLHMIEPIHAWPGKDQSIHMTITNMKSRPEINY